MGCSQSVDTGVVAASATKNNNNNSIKSKGGLEVKTSSSSKKGQAAVTTTNTPTTINKANSKSSELRKESNGEHTQSTQEEESKPERASSSANSVQSAAAAAEIGVGVLNDFDMTTSAAESGGHSVAGFHSGASTPVDSRSLDGSLHGRSSLARSLGHSNSVIGLDSMIETRKEEGDLTRNVVHIEVPFGKPIEEVYDGVHNGPVLGSGISGLVRLVTHKATGVKYAVKCLDLGLVETAEGLHQLREEIFIMCQLDHPNIVRLEEVYESHSEIYLVQELCLGGELFDRLDEQPDYHYTEAECARLVKQMLSAVRYLHSKGIIHRDLKLENFLFSSTSPDSELKMIDFGLSKHFKFGEVHHEAVGTPYTVAPEVVSGTYDERCDIWAIGVITFLLLSGDPPFGGCGGPEPLMTVRSNILKGLYSFEPGEIWDIVSKQAKQFISSLLVIDPSKRPTAKSAQKSPWIREWAKRQMTDDDQRLNPNVVKALVTFKEFSDMRKLLCEVLSFTLLPDQIKDLRKEFEKMDTDGSGEISLAALKQVLMSNAGAGSLGALTETEVEDIFNAMRVRKTETRIHWHEFIAAGLSQCQVDDRNLRLAFDRLDSDHKGYITFENVMDLMGNDAHQSEDAMRRMWGDSMKACNCNHARIAYDDFLLLMKGQTREGSEHKRDSMHVSAAGQKLSIVHESPEADTSDLIGSDLVIAVAETDLPVGINLEEVGQVPRMPLTIDLVEEAGANMIIQQLSPPVSPQRSALDYVTPHGEVGEASTFKIHALDSKEFPPLPKMPAKPRDDQFVRRRSRSVDDQDVEYDSGSKLGSESPTFTADARRAMVLPEHHHEMELLIMDESKTPLVVNRQLYRAHRQMRLAVLEATKRFEEQQARRVRQILTSQREKEDEPVEGPLPIGAGLVLRHGLQKQVSSEAVMNWLKKSNEEKDALVERACKRGGRVRSRRQKTKSDMSGMLMGMSSFSEKSSSLDPSAIEQVTEQSSKRGESLELGTPSFGLSESNISLEINVEEEDEDFTQIRKPTVPGEFRRTKDPFSDGGRYGEY
eukprot:CAMPEP_0202450408 /NCGR_PEP_ID=MMETSP1360-20130828/9012_1 /ASSEMBLY_ACC=CAM_ASM_000848 /TAXON_ID=515479 /ORGANISM="Licmophora paradoxa, Strain CCMP2313" /LENGTH=1047 /DNA_ID=CAMNT_0049068655 /DNA_START=468 /DNA_END=3611 /DNA_ORIENTATION=+